MSINGKGTGYPEWRQTGKTQRNGSETSFASRMGSVNMAGGFWPQRTYKYPNLVHDKNAGYIWADLEIKGLAQHTNNGIVSMGFDGTSNVDIYRKYLESKYGRVTIKDVPKDQKTLEKLGKSMSGNDVVIAPNILEEMANDPKKAAYYEEKIDYFFDTIIPRETARCASMGLVFEPAGVVVHKDGTVTYICGCSDSPERVAQVNAINKAKQEKRAAQREAAFKRSREEAIRRAQEIELSAHRHDMAEVLADYNAHTWETVDANVFYID